MKQSINVWGIQEYEGDGQSCPIIPKNLPFYKKLALFFFRFGVCPMCITMSLTYNIGKFFKNLFSQSPKNASNNTSKVSLKQVSQKAFFLGFLLTVSSNIYAQKADCTIDIRVNVNVKKNDLRTMKGVVIGTAPKTEKIKAVFGKEFVDVSMPRNDKNVLLRIENTHCQGYCKIMRRVRQLSRRDAGLLANLLQKQEATIFKQIDNCK